MDHLLVERCRKTNEGNHWRGPAAGAGDSSAKNGETMAWVGINVVPKKGMGRTQKTGLTGTVKNPRVLQRCCSTWLNSDIKKVFFLFRY